MVPLPILQPPKARPLGASLLPLRQMLGYSNNYLIDTDNAVIVDVEASRSVRTGETHATCKMIERVRERFGLWPERLIADTAYGSALLAAATKQEGSTSSTDFFNGISPICKMLRRIKFRVNQKTGRSLRDGYAD